MIIKVIALVSCALFLVSGHRHHDGFHGGGNHWHGHGHGPGRGFGPVHEHGPNCDHHHGRHHWHRRMPFVNIEVHEPKGLTVSAIQNSQDISFFGVELFVNHNPGSSDSVQCDVCHNTTSVTYGKFIIEAPEVIVKTGDVLYYYVLMGNSTNVKRFHLQKLWVTESIINKCNCEASRTEHPDIDVRFENPTVQPDRRPTFGVRPVPSGGLPSVMPDFQPDIEDTHSNGLNHDEDIPFECDLDPVTNLCRSRGGKSEKLKQPRQDLEREIYVLQSIVEHMKVTCGHRDTTNMLRLESTDLPSTNIEQLTEAVKALFAIYPEMAELSQRIQRVVPDDPSTSIVLIDMVSYIDKQKLLYYARVNNMMNISDYDSQQFGRPDRG